MECSTVTTHHLEGRLFMTHSDGDVHRDDLGNFLYVGAGMADILSPFLVVFPDSDALAFMCFAALMGQIRQNFLEGQPGVQSSTHQTGAVLQHADPKLWRQIGQIICCDEVGCLSVCPSNCLCAEPPSGTSS